MPCSWKTAALAAATVAAGLTAAPAALAATPTPLASMPNGAVTLHHTRGGGLSIGLNDFGLTPGSAHEVALSQTACTAATGGTGVQMVHVNMSGQLQATVQVSAKKAHGAESVSLLLGTPGASGGGANPKQVIACVNVPQMLKGTTTRVVTFTRLSS